MTEVIFEFWVQLAEHEISDVGVGPVGRVRRDGGDVGVARLPQLVIHSIGESLTIGKLHLLRVGRLRMLLLLLLRTHLLLLLLLIKTRIGHEGSTDAPKGPRGQAPIG